jgi:hypothetical protein
MVKMNFDEMNSGQEMGSESKEIAGVEESGFKTRKSLLLEAFEELKSKWSLDEKVFEQLEEDDEPKIDGLPESKVKDLMEIKEKYELDDIDFLFIVGAAVGFYEGQRNVRDVIKKRIATVNEFISTLLRKL